jgi:hypothetical protein
MLETMSAPQSNILTNFFQGRKFPDMIKKYIK